MQKVEFVLVEADLGESAAVITEFKDSPIRDKYDHFELKAEAREFIKVMSKRARSQGYKIIGESK